MTCSHVWYFECLVRHVCLVTVTTCTRVWYFECPCDMYASSQWRLVHTCDISSVSCDMYASSQWRLVHTCDISSVSCDMYASSQWRLVHACDISSVSCDRYASSQWRLVHACDISSVSCDMYALSQWGHDSSGNAWLQIHCVKKKISPFYFWNNSVKNKPISIIFGTLTPEETWH